MNHWPKFQNNFTEIVLIMTSSKIEQTALKRMAAIPKIEISLKGILWILP